MRYESPTIAWRGKVAKAVSQVYELRQPAQEVTGTIECPACRAALTYTVQPNGRSRAHCSAACRMRWTL